MTNVAMFMVDEMVTIYINDRELYKTVANGFLVCMYVPDFKLNKCYSDFICACKDVYFISIRLYYWCC